MRRKLHLSIRTKMIALVGGSILLVALTSTLLGRALILGDKTSYIYDYASSQSSMISERIDANLRPILRAYQRMTANPYGGSNSAFKLSMEALGFREIEGTEEVNGLQIETAASGRVKVSIKNQGKSHFFESDGFKFDDLTTAEDFSLCVFSPEFAIRYSLERPGFAQFSNCREVEQQFKSDFEKGAKEITLNHESFIESYQKTLDGKITVLSIIPKEVAFRSGQNLVKRSILSNLTLFLLIVGFALLILRNIVIRIRSLTRATYEISEGNFNFEFPKTKAQNDEISLLAQSFMFMSKKISELLLETAVKARMQKELETAQMVQKQFFPENFYQSGKLRIESASMPATECGGDFWQFHDRPDLMIFLFGDITGHGAGAALLTATMHAAFHSYVRMLPGQNRTQSANQILVELSETLHEEIRLASKGESSFPALVAVFDKRNSKFHMVTHGHPLPFGWSRENQKWTTVTADRGAPLGSTELTIGTPTEIDFKDGLELFFYTDGILEQTEDGKKINRRVLLDLLAQTKQEKGDTEEIAVVKAVFDQVQSIFGEGTDVRPDDITLVGVRIS